MDKPFSNSKESQRSRFLISKMLLKVEVLEKQLEALEKANENNAKKRNPLLEIKNVR